MKDTKIKNLINLEKKRQKKVINLIASENIVSKDVLAALGSELTNKYSEGYPGRRYYGGNELIDKIEKECVDRALKLFKLKKENWHVNVQALSGSPANLCIYSALLPPEFNKDGKPNRKIMGLKLSSGGHLTHGHPASMTGKLWKSVQYEVDKDTELIDYDSLEKFAIKEKPDMIIAGFTAYPREVDFKRFRSIADKCGALLHADISHFAGLVAANLVESPFLYADSVMTTTHKSLRGPRHALMFVKKDEREFDKKLDKTVIPGLYGGPHNNTIAAVAVALKEADSKEFKTYAKQVVKNAKALAKYLQSLGFRVVSGGTDTHLLLVDVWQDGKGVSGKEASDRLEKENIIVNMNAIPGDTKSFMETSGIRLGTCAETSRGKKEADMKKVAEKIAKVLRK